MFMIPSSFVLTSLKVKIKAGKKKRVSHQQYNNKKFDKWLYYLPMATNHFKLGELKQHPYIFSYSSGGQIEIIIQDVGRPCFLGQLKGRI